MATTAEQAKKETPTKQAKKETPTKQAKKETPTKQAKKETSTEQAQEEIPAEKVKQYEEFNEKVKRTVYIDNLSPAVTDSIIKTALGQFGSVKSVEFIPNYTIPYEIPQSALVEMGNEKEATNVISEMSNYPFMMSGMPRPIRAAPAKAEMFANRPPPPDRKIRFYWLDPGDPDFAVARKLKKLCRKQTEERLAVTKFQLDEEAKLAKAQSDMLKANYKKHEMVDITIQDGAVKDLARCYGIKGGDD